MQKLRGLLCSVVIIFLTTACRKDVYHLPPPPQHFTTEFDTVLYGNGEELNLITFPQFNQPGKLDSVVLKFNSKIHGSFDLENPGDILDNTDSLNILRVNRFELFNQDYECAGLTFITRTDLLPNTSKEYTGYAEQDVHYQLNDSLCSGTGNIQFRFDPGTFLQTDNEILPYSINARVYFNDTVKISLIYSATK